MPPRPAAATAGRGSIRSAADLCISRNSSSASEPETSSLSQRYLAGSNPARGIEPPDPTPAAFIRAAGGTQAKERRADLSE